MVMQVPCIATTYQCDKLTISLPVDSGEALIAIDNAILAGVSKRSTAADWMATIFVRGSYSTGIGIKDSQVLFLGTEEFQIVDVMSGNDSIVSVESKNQWSISFGVAH